MINVVDWIERNRLMLNEDKTKLMVFGMKSNIAKLGPIQICVKQTNVVETTVMKCLGLILQNDLKWDAHIQSIVKRCFSIISMIFKIRQYFDTKSLITITNALVISILQYMIVVWSETTNKNLKKAEKVVRTIARLVTGKIK